MRHSLQGVVVDIMAAVGLLTDFLSETWPSLPWPPGLRQTLACFGKAGTDFLVYAVMPWVSEEDGKRRLINDWGQ